MKSKRGTHVGIMMSFVIFVGFLMFLFLTVQPPVKTNEIKQNTLDNLFSKIEGKTSEEITEVIIYGGVGNCLEFDISSLNVENFNFTSIDENQDQTNMNKVGNKIQIKPNNQNFVKIIFSPENLETPQTFKCNNPENKNISSINKREIFIEEKIINLLKEYNNSYEDLKEELNLGSDEDFLVKFDYKNETILGLEVPNVKSNVFSKEAQIKYLTEKGKEKIGKFILYLW